MGEVAEVVGVNDAVLASLLQLQSVPSGDKSIFTLRGVHQFPPELARIVFEQSESHAFTWALIGDVTVVFTMVGAFAWDGSSVAVLSGLSRVPRGFARFLRGDRGGQLMIVMCGDRRFRVLRVSGGDEVASVEVRNVKCFDQVGDSPVVVFVTTDSSTVVWNFETGLKEVSSVNMFVSMSPFRRANLIDANAIKVWQGLVVGTMAGKIGVFSTTQELITSVNMGDGVPYGIDIVGNRGCVLVEDEGHWKIVSFVIEKSSGNVVCTVSSVKEIDVREQVVGFGMVGQDLCVIAERDRLQVVVFAEYIEPVYLAVSQTSDDVVISAEAGMGCVKLASVKSGIVVLEIAPVDEVRQRFDEQTKLAAQCLDAWCRGDERMCREIASYCKFSDHVLEQCDLRIATISGEDIQSLLEVLSYRARLHIQLVSMIHALKCSHIESFVMHGYSLVVLMTALRWCLACASGECEVFTRAFFAGNSSEIADVIRSEFQAKNYRWLNLLILLAEDCFKHYSEYQELYDTDRRAPPEIIDVVRMALADFDLQWTESFTVDAYRRLATVGLQIIPNREEAISYARKLFDTSIDICEQVAIDGAAYPILADILHQTEDVSLTYSKCNVYVDKLGACAVEPILTCLWEKGYISDIMEIGVLPDWREVAGRLLSFDSLVHAFHCVSEHDGDLLQAAHLFVQAAREGSKQHLYTLDQMATLYSMAKMCCSAAADTHGDLYKLIDNQLMILELQKATGIGDGQVLPPDELISIFLAQRNPLVALCVYTSSFHERTALENAIKLAEIIASVAADVVGVKDNESREPLNLYSYLIESNSVLELPSQLKTELSKLIQNKFTLEKIWGIVSSAHNYLSSK